jgi:hypothetical protein
MLPPTTYNVFAEGDLVDWWTGGQSKVNKLCLLAFYKLREI